MLKEAKEEFDEAVEIMEEVMDDRSVPKNIRKAVSDAKDKICKEAPSGVDFSNAIYLLDDISNDINIPSHTRTSIWTMISRLEGAKEKLKE
ncbi:MAG: UPF0147 family protein [Candidatus Diapherotrites archaeon]|nr:UPF0147 family protein [Candidatus Diapherotrites archaeon]